MFCANLHAKIRSTEKRPHKKPVERFSGGGRYLTASPGFTIPWLVRTPRTATVHFLGLKCHPDASPTSSRPQKANRVETPNSRVLRSIRTNPCLLWDQEFAIQTRRATATWGIRTARPQRWTTLSIGSNGAAKVVWTAVSINPRDTIQATAIWTASLTGIARRSPDRTIGTADLIGEGWAVRHTLRIDAAIYARRATSGSTGHLVCRTCRDADSALAILVRGATNGSAQFCW